MSPPDRIAVDETHDAFGMSDQFSNSPDVQSGVIAFHAMNFDKVIAQRVGPRHIEFCETGVIPHPGEVFEVTAAFRVFRQYKELLGVTQ